MSKFEEMLPFILVAFVLVIAFRVIGCAQRQVELEHASERECVRAHGVYHAGVCVQAVSR